MNAETLQIKTSILENQKELKELRLNLSSTKMTNAAVISLAAMLFRLNQLTCIDIAFVGQITENASFRIPEALSSLRSLISSEISFELCNQICDRTLKEFGTLLRANAEMTKFELEIGQTRITDKGLKAFASQLQRHERIDCLRLNFGMLRVCSSDL
eukprot:TRINITY_DN5299_c0_g1_i3.p1 TRINITY_DN5299_c0_g1~~TRINITY_DN5299_c0_g1_i3.p1  ORF type:complete len:157 (-),score=37.04 TRINITY_DN5299_c0_g1_i3:272-742(-)